MKGPVYAGRLFVTVQVYLRMFILRMNNISVFKVKTTEAELQVCVPCCEMFEILYGHWCRKTGIYEDIENQTIKNLP